MRDFNIRAFFLGGECSTAGKKGNSVDMKILISRRKSWRFYIRNLGDYFEILLCHVYSNLGGFFRKLGVKIKRKLGV